MAGGTLLSSWVLSLGAVYFVTRLFNKYWPTRRFPPGPKPLPLIGNALDMPKSHEYLTYTKWGKEYGDVVHVSALGRNIVVLNSSKAANELDQRSATYADRPYMPMLQEADL